MSDQAILEIALEGVKKFKSNTELYIRPMYWAEEGGVGTVPPKPESTRFCMCIYEAPMPASPGVTLTRSSYAKPIAVTMPIEAKAGCLYPNNARALLEARSRGFDNCLLCDMLGNVAETANANVFMVKDAVRDDSCCKWDISEWRDPPTGD